MTSYIVETGSIDATTANELTPIQQLCVQLLTWYSYDAPTTVDNFIQHGCQDGTIYVHNYTNELTGDTYVKVKLYRGDNCYETVFLTTEESTIHSLIQACDGEAAAIPASNLSAADIEAFGLTPV